MFVYRRESLAEVAEAVPGSGPTPAGVRWASHPVFASPTRVAMNLDASRTSAEQPAPSYPAICFAADSFEEGIDRMVRLRGCSVIERVLVLLQTSSVTWRVSCRQLSMYQFCISEV